MTVAASAATPPAAAPDLSGEVGVRLAVAATGLLATFNAAGVLVAADVHVARRLGRLGGEDDETVLLAAALVVRALRAGSVCLELGRVAAAEATVLAEGDEVVDTTGLPWPDPTAWAAACRASPLVTEDEAIETAGRPLRFVDGLLYLDRYWRQEEQVRADLAARSAATPPVVDAGRLRDALDRLFTGDGDSAQRRAVAVSTLRWYSVLAGGPGTGKTTTLASLLAVLRDQDPALRIALAAPTGKAAARMQEAVAEVDLPDADRARLAGLSASTIHRLLGRRPDSASRFRFDRHRRLPYDVVVVDETSMVPLTLMARLLEAVRPDARVVLVGDPDQLAPVEAGAVLGDLARAPGDPEPALDATLAAVGCPGPPVVGGVTVLDRTWRFQGTIAALAAAIRAGDADAAVAALRSGHRDVVFVEDADLTLRDPAGLGPMRDAVVGGARETELAALDGDAPLALSRLDEHRLLCAHRRGPYGVTRWAADVERWLAEAGALGGSGAPGERDEEWYPGRPLLVTANDHDRGLYNGDTGVVVERPGGPRAVFARGGSPLEVAPSLLDGVQTVHAMTVHRAQGSQFARVSVLLPPPESPLLTRELLYTAVTRARTQVRVVGSAEAVAAAVRRPVGRASGLIRRR